MIDVTGASILFLPLSSSSSMRNDTLMRLAPSLFMSFTAAQAVPPVARRSSMRRTLSPGVIASWWISTVFFPYSRVYASLKVFQGSLPSFLTGMNPALSLSATGAAKMKPRASMPTTLSICLSLTVSVSKSMASCRSEGSESMGLMSLNRIPFFGKSGMSRMADISLSGMCRI